MKQLIHIIIYCLLASVLLTGCQGFDRAQYISDALGVDFSLGTVSVRQDSYGGFFGDGFMAVTISFTREQAQPLLAQFEELSSWRPFPLPENLTAALYGKTAENDGRAPLFRDDSTGAPLLPEIRNGWYYFYDRHAEARDPQNASDLFSRSSYNCTVAVFDTDTRTLYFFEIDT